MSGLPGERIDRLRNFTSGSSVSAISKRKTRFTKSNGEIIRKEAIYRLCIHADTESLIFSVTPLANKIYGARIFHVHNERTSRFFA